MIENKLEVKTPLGEIKAVDAGYGDSSAEYPGIWVEVNGEGMVLVEYDPTEKKHVVRVWDHKDPENDPVYKQVIE